MCAPASQTKPDVSEGELSDDSNLPSRKHRRSRSPQGEADSHQQELHPSYVEMLNAIRGLLDLEVPQVDSLVAPSAFSKKPSKQILRNSVRLSCQKHPGPSVQELKKVVCPKQKLSAQIFLPFLQLLELFS